MTRHARAGLLVGFIFIIGFGIVLTELNSPAPASPAEQAAAKDNKGLLVDDVAYDVTRPVVTETAGNTSNTLHAGRIAHRPTVRRERSSDAETVRVYRAVGNPDTLGVSNNATASRTPLVSRTYTVQENDTLYSIARKVYGQNKGHLYRRILEANRNRLADEDSLNAGQRLVIPSE